MRLLNTLMHAAAGAAFVAMVAGCNGGSGIEPNYPASSRDLNTGDRHGLMGPRLTVQPDQRGSWMKPTPASSRLLYVSDAGTNDVLVYSYPSGTLVGTLTGFNQPWGECVDGHGDVFVTNTLDEDILEYAHGGTSPIATINDPGQLPVGCAYSASQNRLAVTNQYTSSYYMGSISVYDNGATTPTHIFAGLFSAPYFDAYKGNALYVDGYNLDYTFQLAKMSKSGQFHAITVSGGPNTILEPGGVQATKTGLAVGDQAAGFYHTPTIFRMTTTGAVTGTTTLAGICDVVQFFIIQDYIAAPDTCNKNSDIYAYPAGGSPITAIPARSPSGAVVSK